MDLLSRILITVYRLDDPYIVGNKSILQEKFSRCCYMIYVLMFWFAVKNRIFPIAWYFRVCWKWHVGNQLKVSIVLSLVFRTVYFWRFNVFKGEIASGIWGSIVWERRRQDYGLTFCNSRQFSVSRYSILNWW